MKHKIIIFFCLIVICIFNVSCQKEKYIKDICNQSCEDIKEIIKENSGQVVGVTMDILDDEIVDDIVCNCILPNIKNVLKKQKIEDLKEIKNEKSKRLAIIRKSIIKDPLAIFDCYKNKGKKGFETLKKIVDNITKRIVQ